MDTSLLKNRPIGPLPGETCNLGTSGEILLFPNQDVKKFLRRKSRFPKRLFHFKTHGTAHGILRSERLRRQCDPASLSELSLHLGYKWTSGFDLLLIQSFHLALRPALV